MSLSNQKEIRQVISIAAANSDYPIIMQWTGGRAGGHHFYKNFHQPILATYRSIREDSNIILVGGSGFGSADDIWEYLTGDWSSACNLCHLTVSCSRAAL